MKKYIAFLLILLFAANVSGATVSYHFCGKIFQYFALNGQKKKSKCCCGGKAEHKGCCKTKYCKVTVDENKSFVKHLDVAKKVFAEASVEVPFQLTFSDVKLPTAPHSIPLAHAPPIVRTVSLHILHQQFLI